jgi:gas vesicle protein
VFGTGLALGIALGAGVALLTAPASGVETRYALAKRARRARKVTAQRGRDAWEELRQEIRGATQAVQRRKMRREVRAELEREQAY